MAILDPTGWVRAVDLIAWGLGWGIKLILPHYIDVSGRMAYNNQPQEAICVNVRYVGWRRSTTSWARHPKPGILLGILVMRAYWRIKKLGGGQK